MLTLVPPGGKVNHGEEVVFVVRVRRLDQLVPEFHNLFAFIVIIY